MYDKFVVKNKKHDKYIEKKVKYLIKSESGVKIDGKLCVGSLFIFTKGVSSFNAV